MVTFAVRVQPRANRNAIVGEWQGALKVQLTAPPVDNRGNEALRRLLADSLKIPVAAVRILSGERGRTKRVEVQGISSAQVLALVEASGVKARK
jgi:uncharacterized protein (TIGR00251 family)